MPARRSLSADPDQSIPARGSGGGVGVGVGGRHPEAFSTERGSPFSSPNINPSDGSWRRRAGADGPTPTKMRELRVSVEDIGHGGGGDGDGLVWRRYSEVVREVVSVWCRDVDAFDLDPLWLLPKLRTHKSW